MRTVRISLPLYVIGGMLALVILLAAWTIKSNHDRDMAIEDNRIERVSQLNRVNFDLCERIRALFAARRQEAIQNYRNLERDARLLGIKVTPELREASRRARDMTLERFRDEKCPREILTAE